jgi:hypothetical protein
MRQQRKGKTDNRRAAGDIMHRLRELAEAVEDGAPMSERFTVRAVNPPEPKRTPKGRGRIRTG